MFAKIKSLGLSMHGMTSSKDVHSQICVFPLYLLLSLHEGFLRKKNLRQSKVVRCNLLFIQEVSMNYIILDCIICYHQKCLQDSEIVSNIKLMKDIIYGLLEE